MSLTRRRVRNETWVVGPCHGTRPRSSESCSATTTRSCARASRASSTAREGIEVVGTAADGAQAVAQAVELRPDVVLMDLAMPNVDGIAATRRIWPRRPRRASWC